MNGIRRARIFSEGWHHQACLDKESMVDTILYASSASTERTNMMDKRSSNALDSRNQFIKTVAHRHSDGQTIVQNFN